MILITIMLVFSGLFLSYSITIVALSWNEHSNKVIRGLVYNKFTMIIGGICIWAMAAMCWIFVRDLHKDPDKPKYESKYKPITYTVYKKVK